MIAALDGPTLAALPWLFEFWALPHQRPPQGDWKTWVILGGRGAGKTRAGSEWVRSMVEGATPVQSGRARRLALVGETIEQAVKVMIEGDSGILACTPPDRRPEWRAGVKTLVWPNGALAQVFSDHNPESLRGPQFDAAWSDELAKWPNAAQTWTQLQFGLRLGAHPQQIITTTPRNLAVLKQILQHPATVRTHAPTSANQAYLAPSFLAAIHAEYAGTALGRQELEGEFIDEVQGALWSRAGLQAALWPREPPPLSRIVVAIDPAVSGAGRGDECGIVVAGAVTEGPPQSWRAYVLADRSLRADKPQDWAMAALEAFHRFGADRLVAEVNQGGQLVESVIRTLDALVPFRAVHAVIGKAQRAEPVAALYEQGRVFHLPGLGPLEDQLCLMTRQGYEGRNSPDRLDALVWALTDLMLEPARRFSPPRLRTLG